MFVNSPERRNQSSRQAGEAEEGVGEFDIESGDAAEVFDPLKEVFAEVALAIAGLAESGRNPAIAETRDARLGASLAPPLPEGVAMITLVGHNHGGCDLCEHRRGVGDVRVVACTQEETDGLAGFINHGMELCV